MEPPAVRCPNCQKKQKEPCPQRCGCGQSLLAAIAARRELIEARRATITVPDRAPGESQGNEW